MKENNSLINCRTLNNYLIFNFNVFHFWKKTSNCGKYLKLKCKISSTEIQKHMTTLFEFT